MTHNSATKSLQNLAAIPERKRDAPLVRAETDGDAPIRMLLVPMGEAGLARNLNGIAVEMFMADATATELGFLCC